MQAPRTLSAPAYWRWGSWGLVVLAWLPVALLVPGKLQSVGEMGYTFVRDQIAREVIGKDGDRFVPFLASIFFFVWLSNLMGVIPGAQFPIMSNLGFPVALTLLVYITYVFLGFKHQGIHFVKDAAFPPGVPKAMYVLLTPLELLQLFVTRPVTQSIRLFANMFAGHLLIATFSIAAFYLLSASVIGMLGSVASFFVEDVPLTEMYRRLVEDSAARVVEVVRGVLADQPVLVHCTVGKDRTGVTVAITLAAAGVDRDAVVADCARTEALLPPSRNRAR